MSNFFVENSEFGLDLKAAWVEKNPQYKECHTCQGSGKIKDPKNEDTFSWFPEHISCWNCGGTGELRISTPYPLMPQELKRRLIEVLKEFGNEYNDDWQEPFNEHGTGI